MKKKLLCILLTVVLLIPIVPVSAATPKLNQTYITIATKSSYTLKITGTKKKGKWSSSKKSVATVSKKGKVTAKKTGITYITAKIGK